MHNFSIIAAMDSQRGIGLGGKLPWRLQGDMYHFRQISVGRGKNAVIMGRNTWESLPKKFRPLPQRLNVVLSRQSLNLPGAVLSANSLTAALELPEVKLAEEVFIIGGAHVYAQAIVHPDCHKIYLTEIEGDFGCDAFFPEIPLGFSKVSVSEPITEGNLTYRFTEYEKK